MSIKIIMSQIQRKYNPIELYHLRTISYEKLIDYLVDNQTEVVNLFWHPHPMILEELVSKLHLASIHDAIIDVGCGLSPFPKATHLVDFSENTTNQRITWNLDLDMDQFPTDNQSFQFLYCRHVLEDIQNPQHAFQEFIRIASQGYIETPSPLIECLRNVDGPSSSHLYRGYIHHRYLVWSDLRTNTLYFLPKYPLLEYIDIPKDMMKRMIYLANHFPVYWNNYYVWNSTQPPNIVVYRNGINMKIEKDYKRLILEAIRSSIDYTNQFIPTLQTTGT
jgi:hypothetical protein